MATFRYKTFGYAAQSAGARLTPFSFERRALRPTTSRWRSFIAASAIPTFTGRATTGAGQRIRSFPVTRSSAASSRSAARSPGFKAGDHVAVGCMVDSCQHCDQCRKGEEQFCREGNTGTYGRPDRITRRDDPGRLFQASRGAAGIRPARARRARPLPCRARCSAPASPPIRRCARGTSARAAASA